MSKTNLTPANAYTYGGNLAMSLPDNPICTAEDYWNLPEDVYKRQSLPSF